MRVSGGTGEIDLAVIDAKDNAFARVSPVGDDSAADRVVDVDLNLEVFRVDRLEVIGKRYTGEQRNPGQNSPGIHSITQNFQFGTWTPT